MWGHAEMHCEKQVWYKKQSPLPCVGNFIDNKDASLSSVEMS